MTDPSAKIRWGVLGYARIAHQSVIPAILRARNAVFHALASRDPAKLAESRQRFPGGHRVWGSYDELLADPEVDAVYIPLPNSEHCAWTIRAAERGKHVLCEKPIALDAAECRRMIAACAQHGVKLMEAFMYRYTDRTRRVEEVLRAGELGEIRFVHACFRYPMTNPASIKLRPELGGGALYDVGCYPVNFAGLVADLAAGAAPGTVRPDSVAVAAVRAGGVDHGFSALLRYPSGMIASLHCGFDSHRRIGAEIVGTKGVLEVPETFFDNAGSLTLTCGDERRALPVALGDRYRGEIEDFGDAIREGREPRFGLAETLRNAEVLDRLFAAGRS
jgi:predicted dehydrogenase